MTAGCGLLVQTYDAVVANHKSEGTFESPMVDLKAETITMADGCRPSCHVV